MRQYSESCLGVLRIYGELAAESGIECNTLHLSDKPVDVAILENATNEDLIIMNTHSRCALTCTTFLNPWVC